MFRVLCGPTYAPRGSARPIADAVWAAFGRPDQIADPGFIPRFLSVDSPLYESLFAERQMMSLGVDLARSAAEELVDGVVGAWPYLSLVAGLGALYFILQCTVAERDSIRPTMSPGQHKLLRYLPIVFAMVQLFFLAALVVYYIAQTVLRIVQQRYITRLAVLEGLPQRRVLTGCDDHVGCTLAALLARSPRCHRNTRHGCAWPHTSTRRITVGCPGSAPDRPK